MGYKVYLFKKEVREKNNDLSFLRDDNIITNFSDEEFSMLDERLTRYGYKVEKSDSGVNTYNFKDGKYNILATLSKNKLLLTSDLSVDGIFEISQTASEFTDTGEFAKLDVQDGIWEEKMIRIVPTKTPKTEFNQIMINSMKPLFKRLGYKKNKLSFYKLENELIYLIDFQKSVYSNDSQVDFFINCCIHSQEIDKVLGKGIKQWPQEHQCWYRERIENITNFSLKVFTIKLDTDIEVFQMGLENHILEANQYFNNIKTTIKLVEIMIDKSCYDIFQLLDYTVKINKLNLIKRIVSSLYIGYSQANMWPEIEVKIDTIFISNSVNYKAANLVE